MLKGGRDLPIQGFTLKKAYSGHYAKITKSSRSDKFWDFGKSRIVQFTCFSFIFFSRTRKLVCVNLNCFRRSQVDAWETLSQLHRGDHDLIVRNRSLLFFPSRAKLWKKPVNEKKTIEGIVIPMELKYFKFSIQGNHKPRYKALGYFINYKIVNRKC